MFMRIGGRRTLVAGKSIPEPKRRNLRFRRRPPPVVRFSLALGRVLGFLPHKQKVIDAA